MSTNWLSWILSIDLAMVGNLRREFWNPVYTLSLISSHLSKIDRTSFLVTINRMARTSYALSEAEYSYNSDAFVKWVLP